MQEHNILLNIKNRTPNWLTIREAVKLTNRITKQKIKESDIYRHALYGVINLSIYFQSPVLLRKTTLSRNKVKFKILHNSLINRLCFLDGNSFIGGKDLIVSTEGDYISPKINVIDTKLTGSEYVMVQHLLAHALRLPPPVKGSKEINNGVSVFISGNIFQVFERITWQERIQQQIMRLPQTVIPKYRKHFDSVDMGKYYHKEYFPLYHLPSDACFVIRFTELEKLIHMPIKGQPITASTRISTPLSRLFWLACKHNEAISPLIRQPYKLLSIFEQWASDEGITDRFSGDTLKTALERGSPTSVSASKR
ncbi:hypothetical protein BrE312_2747 [Brenneria sp. EniD312]|uniref:hypothetical protein n=1 Tax=Brenneria sp. EniD312 TaxID=598467 RepID=UPI00022F7B10|nr:hypothetical protein [Brenneria sp. EniD312]EHD22123.1 hypothetical protein BrE312_2747 [Brenneria sp. EniD312]